MLIVNYQEYKKFKQGIKLEEYLRLDCMNPLISLQYLKEKHKENLRPIASPLKVSKGIGTLETISQISKYYPNKTLWVPKGVYPRYGQINNSTQWYQNPQGIKNGIIVLTQNFPNQTFPAINRLLENNIIIIDAVYDFNKEYINYLIKTPNLYILRSTSKLQLKKDFVAIFHQNPEIKEELLYWDYELEKNISSEIDIRWESVEKILLTNNIKKGERKGYFMLLDISFKNLLQKNILAAPYSIFTEEPQDINKAMITPLHESIREIKF